MKQFTYQIPGTGFSNCPQMYLLYSEKIGKKLSSEKQETNYIYVCVYSQTVFTQALYLGA